MLDRICDIDLRPVDSRLAERSVEDLTRRTNERLSCQIFPVAGLFTNTQHPRINSAFPEHCLGRLLVEMASCAAGGGIAARFPLRRCLFQDRKRVVSGKSVTVRVDIGGSRI